MHYDVVEAQVIGELFFSVKFKDGLSGTVQFLPSYLYGVFEKLKNPEFLINYKWPMDLCRGGADEIDLAPDSMYEAICQRGEWLLS